MSALARSVTFGAGQTAVTVDTLSGGAGLSVAVEPARAPAEEYDGAGDLHLIYGPGATRVRVRISGAGRKVPSLSGQTLGALTVTVQWPDLTSTVLSLTTRGVASRASDLMGGLTAWEIEGVGAVSSGTDPLGR